MLFVENFDGVTLKNFCSVLLLELTFLLRSTPIHFSNGFLTAVSSLHPHVKRIGL
jgi:hypothetical protein